MAAMCLVDDKHVPLYRILWVADVPHFCGSEECQREGQYEIRLEQGDAVWANQQERDAVLAALQAWGEPEHTDDDFRG
jgi:hypothetical protein